MHTQSSLAVPDLEKIRAAVNTTGATLRGVQAIAPDASTRRFYRLALAERESLVACVYPPGEETRLAHDWAVHQWAWARRLPVPEPISCTPPVILSADLGDCGLEATLRTDLEAVLPKTLACLKAFQECSPKQAPNPPFDAALFRRELEGFAAFLDRTCAGDAAVVAFLDHLSHCLAQHPYRVTHRDFHVNNLLLHQGKVVAVDFQDMRSGPDTYDLVSLLRERAGGELIFEEARWCRVSAELVGWEPGWPDRYLQAACQRGLKVLGTFLRLARSGQLSYLAYVPSAARKTLQALRQLGAPGGLVESVARLARGERV